MAGLLTHLSVAILGFLIIYFAFYKSKIRSRIIYGLAFFFGHLAPDLLDFGIGAIFQRSLKPTHIIFNAVFYPLKVFGHTFTNWLIIGLVIIVVMYLLYKLKKVSKKTLVIVSISIILFLIGILLHVNLDVWIQEANHWI
jgi:hypothetical protein